MLEKGTELFDKAMSTRHEAAIPTVVVFMRAATDIEVQTTRESRSVEERLRIIQRTSAAESRMNAVNRWTIRPICILLPLTECEHIIKVAAYL